MANLVRIEPSLFRADEAWFIFDNGKQYLRKRDYEEPAAKSDFPTPMITRDFDRPVMSMADGKYYTSKQALERTYRADGNPQGIAYECIGEKVAEPFQRPKRDKTKAMEAVKRTLDEMGI